MKYFFKCPLPYFAMLFLRHSQQYITTALDSGFPSFIKKFKYAIFLNGSLYGLFWF